MAILLAIVATALVPAPGRGQTAEEFARLDDQCWELIRAGKYVEAERQAKRLHGWARGPLANQPLRLATACYTLGTIYKYQGRYAEAEPLLRQSLAMDRKLLGNEHLRVAHSLNNLANLYSDQGRYAEAEPLHLEALAMRRKLLGDEHPDVATSLNNLALLYSVQGRYAEAEPLHQEALAMRRKLLGNEHPDLADSLNNLAILYGDQSRYAEAEPLYQQALAIAELGNCDPQFVARIHWGNAMLGWATDRPREAAAALKRAWQAIESQRAQVAGGDLERAHFFAGWTHLFELMVGWQEELGEAAELGEALEAMERGRARMLLDQINAAGLDLLAGVSEDEAETLRRREAEAAGDEASLRKQLELLPARQDLNDVKRAAEEKRLLAKLREARTEYAAAYAAIRSASPAYRLAVGADLKPITLDRVAQHVEQQEALLLEYLLGTEGGYVLVVPANGPPRVETLTLSAAQAQRLRVEPGPLTAKRMGEILMREDETGVLDHLRASNDPQREQQAVKGLAVLWEVLVPEAERKAIIEGEYKRLVVLPDAALAMLPFETLVVEPGEEPREHKYLLDVGPPIIYAPSATILMNLAERQEQARQPAYWRLPVWESSAAE